MGGMNLQGRVVAITGAGRGIGLATAQALAARGARVAIGDIDAALARQAAASLGAGHYGGALDVREPAAFAAFLDAAQLALGPLEVLVNNAGIMAAGPFTGESDALTDTQIDVNVRGVIIGCKLALPAMLARGDGHIVNIASMAGRLAVPGLAVYCATKFAVVGLTETLREEYRDSGVGFSMILPAKVTTELAAGTDTAARGIPSVPPEEVAAAVVASIEDNLGEVAVPRFLNALAPVQGVTPHWLLRGLRRALGDRRVLDNVDYGARAAYDQRLAGLAASRRKH